MQYIYGMTVSLEQTQSHYEEAQRLAKSFVQDSEIMQSWLKAECDMYKSLAVFRAAAGTPGYDPEEAKQHLTRASATRELYERLFS